MKKRKYLMIVPAVIVYLVGFSLVTPGISPASTAPTATPPAENGDELSQDASTWVAPDQEAAKKRAAEIVPFVSKVLDECLLCRQQKLRDQGFSVKDITHSYFRLESPTLKKEEDLYGPVRFMHSKHAAQIKDCALCHHSRPADPEAKETLRCSACHQESFRPDHPERVGLKAAYHLNCIQCHKNMNLGPTDCTGCHLKNVPDHNELVQLKKDPTPMEVTTECLRCHPGAGDDMLSSAHWLWKGPSTYTMDHRKEVRHGKATTAINNF